MIVGCNTCVNVLFHGFMACIFSICTSNICGAFFGIHVAR